MFVLEAHMCYDEWAVVARGTLSEMQLMSHDMEKAGRKVRIIEL